MRAAVALVVLIVGLTLVLSDAAMQLSAQERATLYWVFAVAAAVAGAIGWWLTRVHHRLPTLRVTILVVAVSAIALSGAVVAGAAAAMFLAPGDVRLVVAALVLGTGLGVLVAIGVTGPLTADLGRLAAAAHRVAEGDLSVRTRIDRRDEVGALAASIDRMVDRLARLQAERERGEAARRRLLAAVGHDLRTPLSSLRAAIEALQDGVATEPDRYLAAMARDVDLLQSMVEDLFVLARLEAGDVQLERVEVDVPEVAEAALEAIAPLAAARGVHAELVLDADGIAPVVFGDAQALNRVLRNLLDNALRHARSTVRVALSCDEDELTVAVHDDGPGFPPEFAARAFEVFSRADAARERRSGGAGLGLAIARELVQAHGGRIWIGAGPGGAVSLALPRRRRLVGADAAEHQRQSAHPGG